MEGVRKFFQCPELGCTLKFTRRYNRDRHVAREHNNVVIVHSCIFCNAVFPSTKKLREHRVSHEPSTGFIEFASAHKKKCVIFRKAYGRQMTSFKECVNGDQSDIYRLLKYELSNRYTMKVSLVYYTEFIKLAGGENEGEQDSNERRFEVCLRAPNLLITQEGEILGLIENSEKVVQQRIDDFLENGSGWLFGEVLCTNIEIGNCNKLCVDSGAGSCDFPMIKTLPKLQRIRSVMLLKNQCFFEAVACYFTKSVEKKKNREFMKKKLIMKIRTPVHINSIVKFEKDNQHLQLKINVLHSIDELIYPIYFSKNTKAKHVITLLLYKTNINGQAVNHYTLISNVNRFLARRYGTGAHSAYEKNIRCLNCFAKFTSKTNAKKSLAKHYENCLINKPQITDVPKAGSVIKFGSFNKKFKVPYVGFFDFESAHEKPDFECVACKKIDENDAVNCVHQSLTKAIQIPITYSYLILDEKENVIASNTYTGKDCTVKFLEELLVIEKKILSAKSLPLKMTVKNEKVFLKSVMCHICEKDLNSDKVRDHCHRSGKYLGAAHNLCNLKRQETKKIPMFCHNLSGYDSHFLMQAFGQLQEEIELKALPYNSERFRSITMNSFVFLDSLSFLNASLAELADDLGKNEEHKFKIVDQLGLYSQDENWKKKLILKKGIYPYEYVTSIKKLARTKRIPKKEAFYSLLTRSHVKDEEYNHAKKVFKAFDCHNMIDYTELYCATDVGLLAEVVMSFRHVVYNNFGLDCW